MTATPTAHGARRNRVAVTAGGPHNQSMTAPRRYRYVGPQELSRLARPAEVVDVESADVLDQWLSSRPRRERTQPLTYVITLDSMLRLAPRHSEHVACAAGADVLAAGEIQFALN